MTCTCGSRRTPGTAREILTDAGIPVRRGKFADGDDVHSKLLLASWTGTDGVRRRVIFTGSDDLAADSPCSEAPCDRFP